MKVVYFAVTHFNDYQPGDLIPAATQWPGRTIYVEQGKIAPVLVALLPESLQSQLKDWEEYQGIESDDDTESEVVNEQARADERADKQRKAAEKAERERQAASKAAEEEHQRLSQGGEEDEDDEVDFDGMTKEKLVEYVNDLGYVEAHISSTKPELIKLAKDSDALGEGRYDDVTREVLDAEVARRNDGREEDAVLQVPSDANKGDVIALLEADDEDESGEDDDE